MTQSETEKHLARTGLLALPQLPSDDFLTETTSSPSDPFRTILIGSGQVTAPAFYGQNTWIIAVGHSAQERQLTSDDSLFEKLCASNLARIVGASFSTASVTAWRRAPSEKLVEYLSGAAIFPGSQPTSTIDELKDYYRDASSSRIRAFLFRYPFLAELLYEAVGPLGRAFGDKATRRLSLSRDPEDPSADTLVCFIGVDGSVDDALERLDQFDEGWFLENMPRAAGRLSFSLDF